MSVARELLNVGAFDTRRVLNALISVKNGDFSVRLPVAWTGVNGKIADTFNDIATQNERITKELERVSRAVGREGKIGQRAALGDGAGGGWAKEIAAVNALIDGLVWPIGETARILGGVAKGDLGQTMTLETDGQPLKGEFLRMAKTVNAMVAQLNAFAAEVTRVAREVGTEGKLGGQAAVPAVAGTWKDLTESVNNMAANLTSQVRNIAEVTTAVARGELSRKITVDAKGEILELKNTINIMVDQLNAFAAEVTRVATAQAIDAALPVLPVAHEEAVPDDRESIQPSDPVMLIVEDDRHYARVLLGLAREKGFKGIVSDRGQTALALSRQYLPTAVSLDVFLPDMLGWTVLDHLKRDPATRHIPVQIVTVEEERPHGLAHGAFAYLVKPATTEVLEQSFERIKTFAEPHLKRLLVVEDNAIESQGIVELLGHTDIEITPVGSGVEALAALRERAFDCCVLDLRLPDLSGFELLERVQGEPRLRDLPIIVFTGKDLTDDEEQQLKTMAQSIVLKDVQSPERLLDETALFLHRVVADLPEPKRLMLERLHGSNEALRGRKVLVVDDDARNIFALSTVLENQEMEVLSATNGRQAIETIRNTVDLRAVLMDIMMPEMDGYQTMQEIRKDPRFRLLPILALTAKAMKGDREKCLAAGASDYIAKPVNTDQLLSLLRVWLHR